jgi:sporulation protein YlmC with PRC-barrel domain
MKKMSQFFGMRVYTDKAHYVGEIKDLILDDKEGVVTGLAWGYRGGKVLSIPYDSVMAIGDIILVRSKKVPQPAGA